MSDKYITYLIGAGASCNALPVVKDFPDRMQNFYNEVEKSGHTNKKSLLERLQWLINNTKDKDKNINKYSIDTFAKILHQEKKWLFELKWLKTVVASFLLYEQQSQPVDFRYESFFASILDRDYTKLPSNMRILSWNYDTQFEIAYSKYCLNRIEANMYLQSFPIAEDNNTTKIDPNKFSIIHLNGCCEIYHNEKGIHRGILNPYDILNTAIDFYNSFVNRLEYFITPHISFAWENEDDSLYVKTFRPQIQACVEKTNILVVIGYSFPFFNRKVDMENFSYMKGLEKVYIQDPTPEPLIERFHALYREEAGKKPVDVVPVRGTDQFYIPYEF